MDEVHYSSGKDDWETPQSLYDKLDKEFNFDLDVCANEYNAKHINYYSEQDNGLEKEWRGNCWCNPPYSQSKFWIEKAYKSALKGDATVVMLIPARTDTKAFHRYVYKKPNIEVRFVKGRIKFVGAKHCAPFPSMIVVFKCF